MRRAIDFPEAKLPELRDGYDAEDVRELSLKDANITSVIWATGYGFDFSMVRLPVFDSDGFPAEKRGVTAFAGLFSAGLPCLHNAKSGLLFGSAQDGGYIAKIISCQVLRVVPKLQTRDERRPSSQSKFKTIFADCAAGDGHSGLAV